VSTQSSADEKIVKLFVYGSLMDGFFNHKKFLEGKVISSVPGRVQGSLYHQNRKGYPAIVPGEGWVKGELLEVENYDSTILLCDEIENYKSPGHPDNEYERRTSAIKLENCKTCSAQVYWYARNDLGSDENPVTPLPSGDWREYMSEQSSS